MAVVGGVRDAGERGDHDDWGSAVFRLEYKWLVGITFVLGLIMQILDITILNVALATLGREFGVGAATLQWVLTGYMISLAVFIPSSGWIADRFGSKRTFQFAVVVFTVASVLCGMASEMWMLVAARVLQGVGGGMLVRSARRCCSARSPRTSARKPVRCCRSRSPSRPRWARCSVACSSNTPRGAGSSSSTCRWAR
ncbi:hypothetical protein GCM10025787_59860 [Saccharopolyspora rosea]